MAALTWVKKGWGVAAKSVAGRREGMLRDDIIVDPVSPFRASALRADARALLSRYRGIVSQMKGGQARFVPALHYLCGHELSKRNKL